MIIGKKVISFGLFLVVVEMLTGAGSLKVGLWNYVSKDDQATFQQVTVEAKTGAVFVGGRNSVVKLSGTLKPMAQYRTGPVPVPVDSTRCPGDANGCRLHDVDNFAKILEIIDNENDSGILLFCGSARYGSCSVLSPNDLSAYSALDADSPSTYLAGTGTVYAFFGGEVNASRLLHVARTYDERPVNISTFVLSSSILLPSNSSSAGWQLRPVASFDFEPSAKPRYLVRYVYGFEHGAFVYFVTVQRESTSAEDLAFETKLVRVCRDGSKTSESYTELSLNCQQKTSVATFFNVAQAAHLGPMGLEFSRRFGYPTGETALYVLMARSETDSWIPDPKYGSGLCVFGMTEVRAAFAHAQSDCYQGNGRLLSWVTYMEPMCSKNVSMQIQHSA